MKRVRTKVKRRRIVVRAVAKTPEKPEPEYKVKALGGIHADCTVCNRHVRFGKLTKKGFVCDLCFEGKTRKK